MVRNNSFVISSTSSVIAKKHGQDQPLCVDGGDDGYDVFVRIAPQDSVKDHQGVLVFHICQFVSPFGVGGSPSLPYALLATCHAPLIVSLGLLYISRFPERWWRNLFPVSLL